MNRFVLPAVLLVPAAAFAGSAFDGTWKARMDSIKVSGKPDVYLIENGFYSCASCDPPVAKVAADGAWHKISGHPYYDELMIKIVSPTQVELSQRKNGKSIGTDAIELSADGKTFTGKFTSYAGEKPASGTYTEKRVAAGPSGAHALSGSWLQEQMTSANDALSTVNYAMTPDQFSMKANGQSYEAKFDGHQYPVSGDPGQTKVMLKKLDDRTVEETDYRQGKVVDEIRLAAAADGKSLEITDKDLAHGQTTTITLDKQP